MPPRRFRPPRLAATLSDAIPNVPRPPPPPAADSDAPAGPPLPPAGGGPPGEPPRPRPEPPRTCRARPHLRACCSSADPALPPPAPYQALPGAAAADPRCRVNPSSRHAAYTRSHRAPAGWAGRSGGCDENFSFLGISIAKRADAKAASEGAPRRFPPSWRTWDSGVVNSDIGGPGWSRSPLQELQDHVNAPGNLTLPSVGDLPAYAAGMPRLHTHRGEPGRTPSCTRLDP